MEAEGELDLERLERDLLKHVRQSKLNEIDLSTIGNVTVDREDEISMIASRSFGQPSFGIETDVNAFVDQYDDEIKFDEDDAFSPPPPMSPASNKIKPDALNAIRPQRVSSPAPSSTAAPSLGDDDDAATMVSQVTSNVTPVAPSKKRCCVESASLELAWKGRRSAVRVIISLGTQRVKIKSSSRKGERCRSRELQFRVHIDRTETNVKILSLWVRVFSWVVLHPL